MRGLTWPAGTRESRPHRGLWPIVAGERDPLVIASHPVELPGERPEIAVRPDRSGPSSSEVPGLRERILGLARIAATHESAIPLEELRLLLPSSRFRDDRELGAFILGDGFLSSRLLVHRGQVTLVGRPTLVLSSEVQTALASTRLALASGFVERLLRLCPWLRLAGVSGSTAYGAAKPDDDVDFFLVAPAGRMWITLTLAMLEAKRTRWQNRKLPVFCFNRITEEAACARSFRETRDPLFAREALNLKVLHGGGFYRSLLQASPWMGEPFPGLYERKLGEHSAEAVPPAGRGGRGWSLVNALAFVSLATYLSLVGLIRNARLEKQGRQEARFRTVVARDFCAYESRKYDELGEAYRRAL